MIRRALESELVRSLIVAVIALAADWGILALVNGIVVSPVLSSAMGFATGLVVNYLLSVTWAFRHRALSNRRVEFVIFFLIGVVGLGLTVAVVGFGVNWLNLNIHVAKAASVVIGFGWNFGVRKAILFTSPGLSSSSAENLGSSPNTAIPIDSDVSRTLEPSAT